MGLHHHRKLMPEFCELICHVEQNCSSDCKVCLKFCLTNPQSYYYSQPPPQPPSPSPPPLYLDEVGKQGKSHTISIYLILALSVLAAAFFVVCCCAIYTRFFSRRRVPSNQRTQETGDDFIDEEHGPVLDHPIWYIRTPGLHDSIINAIAVCKYKKAEGLIEGTECSVCLSGFQEDESLRLLPKCNHAFHLPCIDTWLRSHTNCPMCRAPIVTNCNYPPRIPSMQPNVVAASSSSLENTQVELVENNGRSIGGMENSASELRNREEEEEEEGQLDVEDGERVSQAESPVEEVVVSIRPRRSVSLDSSYVANINLALASVISAESDSDSNRTLGDANEQIGSKRVTGNENLATTSKGKSSSFRIRYLRSVPSSMKRSSSNNGKYLLSWYSRSQTQKKPNAILRSF